MGTAILGPTGLTPGSRNRMRSDSWRRAQLPGAHDGIEDELDGDAFVRSIARSPGREPASTRRVEDTGWGGRPGERYRRERGNRWLVA